MFITNQLCTRLVRRRRRRRTCLKVRRNLTSSGASIVDWIDPPISESAPDWCGVAGPPSPGRCSHVLLKSTADWARWLLRSSLSKVAVQRKEPSPLGRHEPQLLKLLTHELRCAAEGEAKRSKDWIRANVIQARKGSRRKVRRGSHPSRIALEQELIIDMDHCLLGL